MLKWYVIYVILLFILQNKNLKKLQSVWHNIENWKNIVFFS